MLKGKLNRDPTIIDDCNTCLIYVRCKHSITETLTKAFLESKLQTETLGYDIIRCKPTPVFRVNIAKSLLYYALTHARVHDCVTDIWGGSQSPSCQTTVGASRSISTNFTLRQTLAISCWDCRGWATGVSYLDYLVKGGSDVMIISEHWLWPFELHKLDEFNHQYRGFGMSDLRLSETSDTSMRACGGVGILWRKSLDVTPITPI